MKHLLSKQTAVAETAFPDRTWSVVDFGAVGDGMTLNTDAIQSAIAACGEAGGGTVVIPSGLWMTGPITLASKVRLHTEKGALVTFSRNPQHYPLQLSYWEGEEAIRCQPPISGKDLHNVAITGEGIFDGNGDVWRPVKKMKLTEKRWQELCSSGGVVDPTAEIWWPDEGAMRGGQEVRKLMQSGSVDFAEYEPYRLFLRPVLVGLYNCTNVLLDGVTFQNSPAWNIHLFECEHANVRRVNVRNPWYSQNGDGIDLESCRYAVIEDCTFDVGDDAICMKSGKNEQGRKRGKPLEHVTIRGCTVYHGHGGFVIGSEMSGGVRYVTVENCRFIGTDVGLRFKSLRSRGGVVEHIAIREVYMKDIAGPAISFNLFYENDNGLQQAHEAVAIPVTKETPEFRDIVIEDTYCDGAKVAIEMIGLPERPLKRIEFRRIGISADRGVLCVNAEDISFEQTDIQSADTKPWTIERCRRVVRYGQRDHASEWKPPIRIFLAGDSTMSEYDAASAPRAGWGQLLGECITEWLGDRSIIYNRAASGRSSKSFIAEGRLAEIEAKIESGDLLLIQFGHNDQKPDVERATEPYGTYLVHLRAYIEAARRKGATPILVTPVQRRSFDEAGLLEDTHGDYPAAMKQLAEEAGVPLIDLGASSKRLLETLGQDRSKELYLWLEPGAHPNYPEGTQDNTHFSEAGARVIAELVFQELKQIKH